MSIAIQKTLSLLLLIAIGFLLKNKLNKEEHKKGLKIIILNIALPAIIFVALLKIQIQPDLLFLPILALVFNLLMLVVGKYVLPLYGIENDTPTMRTLLMLLPSLAPGLSCFPFLVEYLGDEALAWGALADIGNKVFVLVLTYLLAMQWYYRVNQSVNHSGNQKVRGLLISMLNEPINMVMIGAIILLSFGFTLDSLPYFLSDAVLQMKNMMTPLILIFIGVAAVLKWEQLKMIVALLAFRSGITFLISGLLVTFLPLPNEAAILLAVVFPQSACSFWPFAHMSAVSALEKKDSNGSKTFDLTLGLNILAVSLPFSTLVILGVFSSGNYFLNPYHIFLGGFSLMLLAAVPVVIQLLKKSSVSYKLSEEEPAE
ncbi:permease [Echinicola strongylocentroti]|uniref:Permease n=1 Tax=Echinicola strongylocentroti TaxID=1795355 RepID=A0A2Z4IML0_9BACT|nr:permease [Echinicola strongylocentroti]AWW32351.1 permease [Echinicola strongylocentroti]